MSSRKMVFFVRIAQFAAIIAVCSQLSIPLPAGVPLTLQTFAIALCGYLLDIKAAPVSVLVWLILGVVGVPVFAGFRGGLSVAVGKTAGFLWSFPIFAALCGIPVKVHPRFWHCVCGLVGLAVCHLCGVLYFSYLTGLPCSAAAAAVSAPFLLKDTVSVIGAVLFAELMRNRHIGLNLQP